MTWEIEKFPSAGAEAGAFGSALKSQVTANRLGSTYIIDFVAMSQALALPCLPLRDHNFPRGTKLMLDKMSEEKVELFATANPLYGFESTVHSLPIGTESDIELVIEEDIFSGHFIIFDNRNSFKWIGHYSDYAFVYSDPLWIEVLTGMMAFSAYCFHSSEFREGLGGDAILDAEIRELDCVWLSHLRGL